LEIYIPMRVIPNGSDCELIFTLFRLPGISDEKFAADAEWVMRNLTFEKAAGIAMTPAVDMPDSACPKASALALHRP
jgi:hypothetical protein